MITAVLSRGFAPASLHDTPLTGRQTLIDHAPECCDGLCRLIEEVFKETGLAERRRVRIPLSLVPEFGNPINWLPVVDQ